MGNLNPGATSELTDEELTAQADATDPFGGDETKEEPAGLPVEPTAEPSGSGEPVEGEPKSEGIDDEEGAEELSLEDRATAIREKYKDDPSKLATANLYLQQMGTKQGIELGQARNENAELLARIEKMEADGVPTLPEPSSPPVDDSTVISDDDLADLWITDPGKASRVVEDRALARLRTENGEQEQARIAQDAEQFNQALIVNRAREMLLEVATDVQDKAAMQRYSDPKYLPTQEEGQVIAARLTTEWNWIESNLLPNSKTGRYSEQAYKIAQTTLYGSEAVQQARRDGVQETLAQIENPGAGAVIMTPKAGSQSESHVDLSKVTTAPQARRAATKMSLKELEDAANASEPTY